MFGDQRRVDFVDSGAWAMKFFRILSKPEVADDSVWEEEDGEVWRTPVNDLLQEFDEAANDGPPIRRSIATPQASLAP
ncbi:putative vacuolar import/degradation Vid27 [Helianthus anomalus]